ncbi:hypothetical protein [Vibrio sp. R78045]|uniref:hypothetical protein n=1 Tax=Vibrio sp. R78045 TaxID=3093868 RepID=UPI0036F3EB44
MSKPKLSVVISLMVITGTVCFFAYDTFAKKPSRNVTNNSSENLVTYKTDVVEIEGATLPGIEIDEKSLALIQHSTSIALNGMETRLLQSQTDLNVAQNNLDESAQANKDGTSKVTDSIKVVNSDTILTIQNDLKDYEKSSDSPSEKSSPSNLSISIKSILIPNNGIASASVSFNDSGFMLVKEGSVFNGIKVISIESNKIVTSKNGKESTVVFTN